MKTYIKNAYYRCKKYIAIAKINFANKLSYPVDLISEIIFLMFIFSILFYLHQATLLITPSSPIEKLTLAQIMWIVFFANIFVNTRGRGLIHDVNDEILSGQIAYQLNRPYSYIIFHFAQHIGSTLPSIIFGGMITGSFLYGVVGVPLITTNSLLIGSAMLGIGIMINFLLQFCIGLCSFWIGQVDPIRWIYNQIMIIAGGAAIPLTLFPHAIKKIILLLPFSNVIYGAARVIVGCQRTDLFFYISLQIFWLIMMVIITRFIFKQGVKNVVISGG
ncbi:MAG: ABC-2 family transporter protein [bacterium]